MKRIRLYQILIVVVAFLIILAGVTALMTLGVGKWAEGLGVSSEKTERIDQRRHLVLRSSHPSPYSADRGFFGCNHFATINEHLTRLDQEPIDWTLPA